MIRLPGANTFFSYLDEKSFFEWAGSIPCVTSTEAGWLQIDSEEISEPDLRDLLAIMARYQLPMVELQRFRNAENGEWIGAPDAYWHHLVFGGVAK
jgi:hypothetical protein